MPKVLIADKMSAEAVAVFRQRGIQADEKTGLAPDALAAIVADYDGIAVRSSTKVTKALIDKAQALKVVGRAGIGVDNVDVPAATARGIVVMNTPFGNTVTTAEHAVSLMMALARQIPSANASTQAGKWEKNRFMGVELYRKTLGLIGCGNIGTIVADRAQGLKMSVIAHDPFLSPERAQDLGVEKVDLDALLARADFITLHTPLNDHTRGILNARTLAKTKKGVRIINCARGGLVVEADLREAILSGHVAGAAFDVFEEEPAKASPLFGLENVVCTPHLGASTSEAQENVAVQVAEQMSDFLLTGAVTNAVNSPSVTAEEAPRLRPYMKLVERLGSLAGQLAETSLKSAVIEFEGHAATLNTQPLKAVLLCGLLKPFVDSVNMVNAPLVAKERDLHVTDIRTDRTGDYQTLVTLTIESERSKRTFAGTLFDGKEPRLVRIGDVHIETELGAHMLYIVNEDKPGLVGAIGTVLGGAGINIASLSLSRNAPGGQAMTLIEIDQAAPDAVLKALAALPHVRSLKPLAF